MPVAFPGPVGMQGVEIRSDNRQNVWRSRQQERCDVAISQSCNDLLARLESRPDRVCQPTYRREEVGHRPARNDTEQQHHKHICLDIQERELGALPEGLMLRVNPIILADILLKTPRRQSTFLLCQPRGCPREVG